MASPSIADMFTSTGLATELHLDTGRYMMIPVIIMGFVLLGDNDIHDTSTETGHQGQY